MDVPIDFFVRGTRNDTREALREYTVHRLSFAVRRFTHRVRHIMVRVVDENGPRRGVDSRCSVTADLVGGRQLFVEATGAWPFAAITAAAQRFSEALRRNARRDAVRRRGTAAASSRTVDRYRRLPDSRRIAGFSL